MIIKQQRGRSMPTVDQILAGLRAIANTWQPLSIIWHFYFACFAVALICSARPLKRTCGILLSLPLLSVSLVAWLSQNPFNGIVYALISFLLIYVSLRLPCENVRIAPMRAMIPGMVMIIFGWIYPHFLNTSSLLSYLYAAPIGVIPCATLSIVIGFALVLSNLESRALTLILGIAGLFYGLTGVLQLHVTIDWILLIGAVTLLSFSFIKKKVFHQIKLISGQSK